MPDEYIERIFKNTEKAKFIEEVTKALEDHDKLVIILIKDKDNGGYSSIMMTLGLNTTYEAYGILEVGKHDLLHDDDKGTGERYDRSS